jgi:hypothetical protein
MRVSSQRYKRPEYPKGRFIFSWAKGSVMSNISRVLGEFTFFPGFSVGDAGKGGKNRGTRATAFTFSTSEILLKPRYGRRRT